MGRLNEGRAEELVGDVRAAHERVHEVVEQTVTREHLRLRAASKTRKSAERRERILAEARALMEERGRADFQVAEVAERCGVTKGALYYYFADKDALVQAVFAEVLDETVEAIEAQVAQAPTAREALELLAESFAQRLHEGSPFALALTREVEAAHGDALKVPSSRFSRVVGTVSAQIERGKREGVVDEGVDATLAAVFVLGGYLMVSLSAADFGLFEGRAGLKEALVGLTLHGLG